jgi:hypothetical protein
LPAKYTGRLIDAVQMGFNASNSGSTGQKIPPVQKKPWSHVGSYCGMPQESGRNNTCDAAPGSVRKSASRSRSCHVKSVPQIRNRGRPSATRASCYWGLVHPVVSFYKYRPRPFCGVSASRFQFDLTILGLRALIKNNSTHPTQVRLPDKFSPPVRTNSAIMRPTFI